MKDDYNHINYKQVRGLHPGPHLLITAGVHGDEYEPVFMVLRLIEIMKNQVFAGTLTLVPVSQSICLVLGSSSG